MELTFLLKFELNFWNFIICWLTPFDIIIYQLFHAEYLKETKLFSKRLA